MTIRCTEYDTRYEAIQHAMGDRVAITLGGKNLVVPREDAHRLEAAGVSFAYLGLVPSHNRIVTIPVNETNDEPEFVCEACQTPFRADALCCSNRGDSACPTCGHCGECGRTTQTK